MLAPPVPLSIPATVDIDLTTFNLKSGGKWITAYIGLPNGYDVHDIDIGTVLLQGLPVQDSEVQGSVLMVTFDRKALNGYLEGLGLTLPADVDLAVVGELRDGTQFTGSDTIAVISPGKKK